MHAWAMVPIRLPNYKVETIAAIEFMEQFVNTLPPKQQWTAGIHSVQYPPSNSTLFAVNCSLTTNIHCQGHRSHRHNWPSSGRSRQSRPFSYEWPPTVRPYRSTLEMVRHNPGQWCTLLRWCSHQRIPPCSYEGDDWGTVHLWNEGQFMVAVTFLC